MMSRIPMDLSKVRQGDVDVEALRAAIIAEMDAINLYEQLAASAESADVRKVLLDVAREEKTHVGEFTALLLRLDDEQTREMESGRREVEELTR